MRECICLTTDFTGSLSLVDDCVDVDSDVAAAFVRALAVFGRSDRRVVGDRNPDAERDGQPADTADESGVVRINRVSAWRLCHG